MENSSPNCVTRSYSQQLTADPETVFPLLCPVREADWIEGWDPIIVYSNSGKAETDCVFITTSSPEDSIWYITRHEPDSHFLEMIRVTPSVTASKLTIQVSATDSGSEAQVTYSHTSLGPEGDKFIESYTESYYEQFMKEWEERLNYYLENNSKLVKSAG